MEKMGRFVQIAMVSGSELSYRLLLSRDLQLLTPAQYVNLNQRLERVMKMLSVLSSKIRSAAVVGFEPKANSQ